MPFQINFSCWKCKLTHWSTLCKFATPFGKLWKWKLAKCLSEPNPRKYLPAKISAYTILEHCDLLHNLQSTRKTFSCSLGIYLHHSYTRIDIHSSVTFKNAISCARYTGVGLVWKISQKWTVSGRWSPCMHMKVDILWFFFLPDDMDNSIYIFFLRKVVVCEFWVIHHTFRITNICSWFCIFGKLSFVCIGLRIVV